MMDTEALVCVVDDDASLRASLQDLVQSKYSNAPFSQHLRPNLSSILSLNFSPIWSILGSI